MWSSKQSARQTAYGSSAAIGLSRVRDTRVPVIHWALRHLLASHWLPVR